MTKRIVALFVAVAVLAVAVPSDARDRARREERRGRHNDYSRQYRGYDARHYSGYVDTYQQHGQFWHAYGGNQALIGGLFDDIRDNLHNPRHATRRGEMYLNGDPRWRNNNRYWNQGYYDSGYYPRNAGPLDILETILHNRDDDPDGDEITDCVLDMVKRSRKLGAQVTKEEAYAMCTGQPLPEARPAPRQERVVAAPVSVQNSTGWLVQINGVRVSRGAVVFVDDISNLQVALQTGADCRRVTAERAGDRMVVLSCR